MSERRGTSLGAGWARERFVGNTGVAMAVCTKHADMETLLSCTTCDRPFCFRCLLQGPVGSKCRDCTKGVAIDAGRTERAKAAVRYSDRDRSLSVRILTAALLVVNGVLFNRSGAFSGVFVGPHRYSVHAGAIRSGQWWRLFTGAVAGGSYLTVVIAAAASWWIGRMVAPRLGQLNFWAVVCSSIGGGVVALLLLRPYRDGYGILSVVGGLGAAYALGRRRSVVGALTLPFGGRMGYGIFFIGWVVYGTVSSDPGLLIAMAGGAAAAAPVAMWIYSANNKPQIPGIGFLFAVALFAVGSIVASQANSTTGSGAVQDVLNKALDGGLPVDPWEAPTGWMSVGYWEERTDVGDFQSFRLRCVPTPELKEFRYDDAPDPTIACGWLKANVGQLKIREEMPADCATDSLVVWRSTVVGDYKGKRVDIDVSGAEGCATAKAQATADAFWATLPSVSTSANAG